MNGDVDASKTAAQVIWHQPFEKLKMSADDSSRLVWLDFMDDGEQVRDGDYFHLIRPVCWQLNNSRPKIDESVLWNNGMSKVNFWINEEASFYRKCFEMGQRISFNRYIFEGG